MDQGNLDASTLQYYLRGVEFPAEKEEVASTAESNGATQDLAAQIRNADTDRFESAEEVMGALQSPPRPPTPFSLPGAYPQAYRQTSYAITIGSTTGATKA
jgi:hypothetical protein